MKHDGLSLDNSDNCKAEDLEEIRDRVIFTKSDIQSIIHLKTNLLSNCELEPQSSEPQVHCISLSLNSGLAIKYYV